MVKGEHRDVDLELKKSRSECLVKNGTGFKSRTCVRLDQDFRVLKPHAEKGLYFRPY